MDSNRITTPFSAQSTAAEVIAGIDEAGPPIDARHGVAAFALDPEAAARLWQVSTDTLAS